MLVIESDSEKSVVKEKLFTYVQNLKTLFHQGTFFYYLQEEFSFTQKLGINSPKDPINTIITVISYVLFMTDFAQVIRSFTQFTKYTASIRPVLTFSIICLKKVYHPKFTVSY